MKNYTLMINRKENTPWDYKSPSDSVDEYEDLTKELLYILYTNECLYKKPSDFVILADGTPLSNTELMELGLLDSNNNYLHYPNAKSDLLDSFMEYINNKQGIYLFGDFAAVTAFLINFVANYKGKEKIALFCRSFLKIHTYGLNGNVFERHTYNHYVSKYEEDYSLLKEQISQFPNDSLIIIDGIRDYDFEIEIIHYLKDNGYRFIIANRTTLDRPFNYEEKKDFIDSFIKLRDGYEEEAYKVMNLYLEDEYYISYKYDEKTRRIFGTEALKQNTITFDNVAGFEELKKELIKISKWWKDYKKFGAKGIDLPHGILFYGCSGCGKSLMARAFINEIKDFKIISIDNELEILEKFELAKKHSGLVIVFMDELEYLYKKNHRDLLTAFDSLNSSSNVFIVATTNELDNVEGPLTRRGRLDFLIEIGRPNEKERIEILKYYFSKCNVEADINYDYLSYITTYLTSAELKALVNDSVLRYGNHLTITDLEAEIDRLRNRKSLYYGDFGDSSDYMTAVHEIGHTIVVLKNSKYFTFYKTTLESNSRSQGICRYIAKKESIDDSKKMIADIDISLAGYLACKVLYDYDSTGCRLDLENARHKACSLINSYGYGGFDRVLNHSANSFTPSNKKMQHNELLSEKILKDSEKRVRKLIKKNKTKIIKLSNILYEKKTITAEDIKTYL